MQRVAARTAESGKMLFIKSRLVNGFSFADVKHRPVLSYL
jgi:hypothetical protein